MPNLKSAKKKLRQDKKRQSKNLVYKKGYKKALKSALTKKTKSLVSKAFSLIDKAAKKRVIHRNKAARLKQRLSKKT